MLQSGRSVSSGGYRYGYQGQEVDNDMGGLGQHLNYTYRNHDSCTCRFGSVDPLWAKYPYWSPYAFSGNRVIDAVELEGLEAVRQRDSTYMIIARIKLENAYSVKKSKEQIALLTQMAAKAGMQVDIKNLSEDPNYKGYVITFDGKSSKSGLTTAISESGGLLTEANITLGTISSPRTLAHEIFAHGTQLEHLYVKSSILNHEYMAMYQDYITNYVSKTGKGQASLDNAFTQKYTSLISNITNSEERPPLGTLIDFESLNFEEAVHKNTGSILTPEQGETIREKMFEASKTPNLERIKPQEVTEVNP